MIVSDLFIHHLPQPFYRVQIRAVWRQVMKVNIHYISPVFHQPALVVTRSVKDNMNLLADRIGFTQGNEKLCNVTTVDTVIFAYHCFTDIGQIQGAHQVQTGTAARCFFCGFLAFSHPAHKRASSPAWDGRHQ
ncbi:hypothetical protein SAMN02982990_02270 [Photorhabdus luminescens]|uniref:Uncharacterized protein n=1 Tax=Photorhabdus luminescens TaxID=29488 RepID=A0A1G5QUD4_PHOLU|nr:hypothetical protein SAMN02982990_02270 [Photorhabdus luminescens]